jgi:predicted dehydrogenase
MPATSQPPGGPLAGRRLRFGILGAARIAPAALIAPARESADVEVVAVAARDATKARDYAERHGIAIVHDSNAALLADSSIDAVYNALPNGLHGCWTSAALEAGKHVLCEKPFTANAAEAEAVAAVARRTGLVCMEAFHYRYHALTRLMLEIIASGELGELRHVEAWFNIPLAAKNIRWDLALAGGSLMDVGCYAIHIVRTLAGAEPSVRSARAKLLKPGIDRWLRAELAFADGRTARITASMLAWPPFSAGARVVGSKGTLQAFNPYLPHLKNSLVVRSATGRRKEALPSKPTTYALQLQSFTAAVSRGEAFPTNVDDAIANMRVIDACYLAAGLPRREATAMR